MDEQYGTLAYVAPEILRDQGYYGFAVDIWSSGAPNLRLWRVAGLATDANTAFHFYLKFTRNQLFKFVHFVVLATF